MAQPTGTIDSYDEANSLREDLQNVIFDVSPTETPFLTAIGKTNIRSTNHEWQIDSLAAAADNAQIEGNDVSTFAGSGTTRVSNYTQISWKPIIVTETAMAVDLAGKKDSLAYQVAKQGRELKRDMEVALTGNYAKAVGNASTARHTRSLESWYETNASRGASGANGSDTEAATDTTATRSFTEDLLKTVLDSIFTNSGDGPNMIMLGAFNKRKLSAFAGNATRMIDATKNVLDGTIDIYRDEYGNDLKVVPNRFSRARTVHVLNTELFALGTLRPMAVTDLAKTGSAEKRKIETEYTLISKNEAGSGVIADLTTS